MVREKQRTRKRKRAFLSCTPPPSCILPFAMMMPDHRRPHGFRGTTDRLLALVAHPDDETAGCGAWLAQSPAALVVFATDGAPEPPFFWESFGSRQAYAELRAREAGLAAKELGLGEDEIVFLAAAADQQLYRHLDRAWAGIMQVVERWQPSVIVTHAYEGGHPDHDACSFLAARVAQQSGIEVWEMPFYHRSGGDLRWQQFHDGEQAGDVTQICEGEPLRRKLRAAACHHSQRETLAQFDLSVERFRPQSTHDYTRPPHPGDLNRGQLNYEAWGWPMTGAELCSAFKEFSAKQRGSIRNAGRHAKLPTEIMQRRIQKV